MLIAILDVFVCLRVMLTASLSYLVSQRLQESNIENMLTEVRSVLPTQCDLPPGLSVCVVSSQVL